MPAAVLDAFRAAANDWVSLEELQAAASRKIAEHTRTEAGLVTSGSAAALTLGAAAIMAGHNLGRMERLPVTDEFPNEFLVSRDQRSGYDHAVRAAGARLVDVGFNEVVSGAGVRRTEPWEYEAAINSRSAGILFVHSRDNAHLLKAVCRIASAHQLPVLVDAAGELPPRRNLYEIAACGADLVAFSGGKAIRGPQSTGILCGRQQWISSAALQMLDMDDHYQLWAPPANFIQREGFTGHPRHGIGRALKVSKEEIVALLTALDLFASGAYDVELEDHRRRLGVISTLLDNSSYRCSLIESIEEGRWPILEVIVDGRCRETAFRICQELRQGSTPIYLGHGKLDEGILVINPLCLKDDDARVIGERLLEF